MKRMSFALSAALLVIPLSACSGKPDASDVEGLIKEVWAPCKLVKVTDIKKTNGVDQGDSYQMAISYKLELVQDVAIEDVWDAKDPKRDDTLRELNLNGMTSQELAEAQKKSAELNAPYWAAKKRRSDFLNNNCPGPIAGSVLGFLEAFKEKSGTALMKGDSAERVTEFTMIKTENGWMAQ